MTPPITRTTKPALGVITALIIILVLALPALATLITDSVHYGYDGTYQLKTVTYTNRTSFYSYDDSGNIQIAKTGPDTSKPVSTITQPTSPVTGTTLTLTGTSTDVGMGVGAVEVSIDGGAWQKAIGTTSWSYDLPLFANRTCIIKSRATDYNGNEETPGAGISVVVVNVPPSIIITSPVSGTDVTGVTSNIHGSVMTYAVPLKSVKVSFDSYTTMHNATINGTGWSYNWTLPANSSHTVYVKATDQLDNTGATVNVAAVVNNIPASTVGQPGTLTGGFCNLTGGTTTTGPTISKVELSFDNNTSWKQASTGSNGWSYNWLEALGVNHTVLSRATDALGNVETTGSPTTLTVARPAGRAYSWGYNNCGQLGNNDNSHASSNVPVEVTGYLTTYLDNIIAVSGGTNHSIALDEDGNVYTWGYNEYGNLGDNTTTMKNAPVKLSLTGVVQIAAGGNHSMALREDGRVFTWGRNNKGQLGDKAGTYYSYSKRMEPYLTDMTDIISIAAGKEFSMALKRDGTIYSWGSNSLGQIGNSSVSTGGYTGSPVLVQGQSGPLSGVKGIKCGSEYGVALKDDNKVYSWGAGLYGEMGNGANLDSATPVEATGLTNVKDIDAGLYHTMALDMSNNVWSWGYNFYGQLGDGQTTSRNTPHKIDNITVNGISAGGNHSIIKKTNGTVSLAGYNYYGQLGNGNNTSYSTFQDISQDGVLSSDGTAFNHTLAIVDVSPPQQSMQMLNGDTLINSRSIDTDIIDNGLTYDLIDEAGLDISAFINMDNPLDSEVLRNSSYTISGTASWGGLLIGIEVSTDNGSTWSLAEDDSEDGSWSSWSYDWTLPEDGMYIIKCRSLSLLGDSYETDPVMVKVYKFPPVQ